MNRTPELGLAPIANLGHLHGPALCLLEDGSIIVAHKPRFCPWQDVEGCDRCRRIVYPVAAWEFSVTTAELKEWALRAEAARLTAQADSIKARVARKEGKR
jgi:hypothetical protein